MSLHPTLAAKHRYMYEYCEYIILDLVRTHNAPKNWTMRTEAFYEADNCRQYGKRTLSQVSVRYSPKHIERLEQKFKDSPIACYKLFKLFSNYNIMIWDHYEDDHYDASRLCAGRTSSDIRNILEAAGGRMAVVEPAGSLGWRLPEERTICFVKGNIDAVDLLLHQYSFQMVDFSELQKTFPSFDEWHKEAYDTFE